MATNGTLPVNQTNLSVVNQTIASWPSGAMLWLVWQMTDATGKAQGLALDDLSFSASVALPLSVSIPAGGTNIQIAFPSALGQAYQLEYSTDLANPTWSSLGAAVAGTGETITLTRKLGASQQGFFRVQVVP
jgi:hypothetical protein